MNGTKVTRRGCCPGPRGVWAVAPAVSTPHCRPRHAAASSLHQRGGTPPSKPIYKPDATSTAAPAETEKMQVNVDDYLPDSPSRSDGTPETGRDAPDRCVMPDHTAATGTWTTSTRATSTWIAVHAGLAPPCPPCMAPVAPLFHPLPSYADAAGSSLHQRGGTPHPMAGVPLACH